MFALDLVNRHAFDPMVDLLVDILTRLDAATAAEIRDFTPTGQQ